MYGMSVLAGLAGFIAGQEWIILVIVVVVLIFGAKKIPELAKTMGRAKGEFEKGKIEGEKELNDFKDKEQKQ
ncbi:MAG: twin-arginine translocase TatA/TatE family subunit [Nitrosopumilaceae archaeon]|nr:twin-arginine translocase TatA/TatE family subunit [Nitrosopumilaceae archaeon]